MRGEARYLQEGGSHCLGAGNGAHCCWAGHEVSLKAPGGKIWWGFEEDFHVDAF